MNRRGLKPKFKVQMLKHIDRLKKKRDQKIYQVICDSFRRFVNFLDLFYLKKGFE